MFNIQKLIKFKFLYFCWIVVILPCRQFTMAPVHMCKFNMVGNSLKQLATICRHYTMNLKQIKKKCKTNHISE